MLSVAGIVVLILVIVYGIRSIWCPPPRKVPREIDPIFSMFRRHALYSRIEHDEDEDADEVGDGSGSSWMIF